MDEILLKFWTNVQVEEDHSLEFHYERVKEERTATPL